MAGTLTRVFLICLCFWQMAGPISASPTLALPEFAPDRILIKPKKGLALNGIQAFHSSQKSQVLHTFETFGNIQVLRVPADQTVIGLIAAYQASGLVEFAEPDYVIRAAAIPNDPYFTNGTLWALNNYGQNGGTPGADIHATAAWDILSSASNIVVAVLDTGIRSTHEDLAANMWINTNDNSHGFNAFTQLNDPEDDNGHGTIIAGVLGAVGNNGKGVTGVAWNVQLMAGKCLDSSGKGSDSTLIACIEFARTNGARIVNASLDSSGYSAAVSNAIVSLRDDGIIFVGSAGNNFSDVDATPRYPAGYDIDNIVSVAYTTRTDELGFLSNYGATNVDLAAPGDAINSTWSPTDTTYYTYNAAGTSFAAAYVSGALALILEKFPNEDYHTILSRLWHGTDRLPGLAGKCVTEGRLNLEKALCPTIELLALPNGCEPFELRASIGPNRTCSIESSVDLTTWTPVFTNSTTTNWSFDFSDSESTNSLQTFYRAVSLP